MRMIIPLGIILTLVFGFAIQSNAVPVNHIRNGGFAGAAGKGGSPKGWQLEGAVKPGLLSGNDGDDPLRGYFPGLGRYLRLESESPTTASVYQKIDASAIRGKLSIFECTTKCREIKPGVSPEMRPYVSVECESPAKGKIVFESKHEGVGEWGIVRLVCNVPPDATSVRVVIGFRGCAGKFDVRDAGLWVVGAPKTNQLAPGAVETDYGDGFKQLVCDGKTWYDRSEIDPNVGNTIEFTAAERKAGLVIFRRPGSKVLPVYNVPARNEVLTAKQGLKLALCAGESRSAALAVYPLRQMRSAGFVIGDLKSKSGGTIPASALHVDYLESSIYRVSWYAEYARMPRMLRKFDTIDIPAGNGAQFWLYCTPPDTTPPGTYTGKIRLAAETGEQEEIRVSVTVYPFKLDPMPLHWSMYYYYLPDDALPDQLELMKSVGMTSVIYSPPRSSIESRLTIENGKVHFDFTSDDEFMNAYKRAGYDRPVIYYPRLVLLKLMQLLNTDKQASPEWWNPTIQNPEEYPAQPVELYKEFLRLVSNHAKTAGWPETILYLSDEPDSAWKPGEAEAVVSYRAAKEAVPYMKTFCTLYYPDMMKTVGKYTDYISSQGLFTLHGMPRYNAFVQECRKSGSHSPALFMTDSAFAPTTEQKRSFVNNAGLWASEWPGLFRNNYWFMRAYAGIVCAKSGFEGMNIWYWPNSGVRKTGNDQIHIRAGEPGIDWSLRKEGNEIAGCGLSLYGLNNHGDMECSTLLEGIRDGILDYRYIATLRNAISKAKTEGRDISRVQKQLDGIIDQAPALKWESIYKYDRPGNADANGWSVERNDQIVNKLAGLIEQISN